VLICRLKQKRFNAEIVKLQKEIAMMDTTALSTLEEGTNQGTYVCKIMACFGISADPVPVSFIIVDGKGTLMALSIYHVNAECTYYSVMKMFQSMIITNPVLRKITVRWDNRIWEYHTICVENPSDICVGGTRLRNVESRLTMAKPPAT